MRNPELWKPTRLVRNRRTGVFEVNHAGIFGGSGYSTELQTRKYIPLIQAHISGHVLDMGCGPVPYYELYADRTTSSTCVDRRQDPHVAQLLDQVVDLNDPLPFPDSSFDSVLLTDVLAHMRRPWEVVQEIGRVLKPGGKVVITAPFVYWLCEYPHEYYHPTRFALEDLCQGAGLEVIHIEPYGGQADVLMDTLNKIMSGSFSNRVFRLLARSVELTGWIRRNRERTQETYALGYSVVARKPG